MKMMVVAFVAEGIRLLLSLRRGSRLAHACQPRKWGNAPFFSKTILLRRFPRVAARLKKRGDAPSP